MKKITIPILITFLIACSAIGFDMKKAQTVSKTAVEFIKTENFSELAKLYSEDFGKSETQEIRIEKFKKILNAVGEIKQIELSDSANIKVGENNEAEFKYKMTCSKVNVVAHFKIINENGNYLISGINIEQESGK
jgi:hypothetical protein